MISQAPSPFDPDPPARPNPVATAVQCVNTAIFAALALGAAYLRIWEFAGLFALIGLAYARAVYGRMKRHLAP